MNIRTQDARLKPFVGRILPSDKRGILLVLDCTRSNPLSIPDDVIYMLQPSVFSYIFTQL